MSINLRDKNMKPTAGNYVKVKSVEYFGTLYMKIKTFLF